MIGNSKVGTISLFLPHVLPKFFLPYPYFFYFLLLPPFNVTQCYTTPTHLGLLVIQRDGIQCEVLQHYLGVLHAPNCPPMVA